MSADNGIYVAQFPDGYRVIHAQAIDNLWWNDESGDPGLESDELQNYRPGIEDDIPF